MTSGKCKITHVTRYASPHVGGIEAVIDQINQSLPDEEFEKEVLCCSNVDKSSVDNGVKFTRCKYLFEFASNTISPIFLWKLSRVETDILHYHMPYIFAVICHFIARPKCKKVFVSYHAKIVGFDRYMWLFNGIYKKFWNMAAKIHVLSPQIIDTDEVLYKNREKCAVVPFGIDLEDYTQSAQTDIQNYRDKYKGKKIILAMGRYERKKGFIYLIEAMEQVENAVLLLAGDGSYRKQFEDYISEHNLSDKVKLLGFVTDKKEKNLLFDVCDIFVLPSESESESFGIVQLEAMTHSKPVINTNIHTGVNYVSPDGVTGLTVEPKNPEQLAQAIKKLLDDDTLRIQYGQNARKRAEELFDIEKIKGLYKEMYRG